MKESQGDRMRKSTRIYRFPSNRRAEELSLTDQVCYIEGELKEVKQAILLCESKHRIIEELWDTVHAAESALRKFPLADVARGFIFVLRKNAKRGDYRWLDA